MNVWDKLSKKYDTLWVQKYSLTPSRSRVLALLERFTGSFTLLDVGCATGQLLCAIQERHPGAVLHGIDKSSGMIALAKAKNADISFAVQDVQQFESDSRFQVITCCHSFPYYPNKRAVLQKLSNLLADNGKAIFIQASINNLYDRFVMAIIEKTAEKADYLSKADFCRLAEEHFVVEQSFVLREQWFMPSICGFVLGKKP